MPEMFILAFSCLALACSGAWYAWSAYGRMRQILATPTSPVQELIEAGKRQRANPGGKGRQVEIKGVIRAEELLTAEMSNHPCVWYQAATKMKVRRVEYRNGKRRSQTTVETLTHTKDFKCFWVEDTTGRIRVMPEGAEVEGFPTIRKEEAVGDASGGIFSLFDWTQPDERILANIYEEDILPVDKPVYVIGELSGGTGQPFIRKPLQTQEGDRLFVISVKSEEEILRAHRKTMWLWLGLSILSLISMVGSFMYAVRGHR